MTELETLQENNRIACGYVLEALESILFAQNIMDSTKSYYKKNGDKNIWRDLDSGVKINGIEVNQSTLYDLIKNIDVDIFHDFQNALISNKDTIHQMMDRYRKMLYQDMIKKGMDNENI